MSKLITAGLAALLTIGTTLPAEAQSWRTVSKARRIQKLDFLQVNIEYAVGTFRVEPAPDGMLYRFESRYDEEVFHLNSNYLESKGRGRLRIALGGEDEEFKLRGLRDYDREAGELELRLSRAVPLALNMQMGASEARLDLGGLRLREVVLETGASDTHVRFSEPNLEEAERCEFAAGAASLKIERLGNSNCREISIRGGVGAIDLDFSGEWRRDATADIKVGLGGIDLRIPADLGVRIEKDTFLMAFDAADLEKQDGGVYLSRNWESAARKLTIRIAGALGGVTVARR